MTAQHYASANDPSKSAAQEFLAFKLGQEEYGVDILKVQEIRGHENVTRIANAPEFIKGVVNLRGTIVPILDMRIRLNIGEPVYNQFTVVIVLNVAGRVIGMVVDGVSDVITLSPEHIRPAPEMGNTQDIDHLVGLGIIDDRMLILLDAEKFMPEEDAQTIPSWKSTPTH